MTVSVIIPAYNAAATLGHTLKALLSQDYKPSIEIIVVDDGSTDHTGDVVKGFPSVVYLRQENTGPAGARNAGTRRAGGQFYCFTDSDCVPHPDWISLLIKGFSSSRIGVVCGSYGIANSDRSLARGIHAEIIFRHTKLMPDFPKAFGSYNFCVRKNVFEEVGGFQCLYRQASGEDNDLSYRILAAGHQIFFEKKALVDHYHTDHVVKYLKEQFRHGFWRARMYMEHPCMVAGDDYTFWKDMVEVPLVVGCLVLYHLFLPFLVFEIIFGCIMLSKFIEGIFYGFVMYLRAFSRTFGLSTGFFYFLFKRMEKKFK